MDFPPRLKTSLAAALLMLAGASAWAQVTADNAWARPTVPGQQAGGGFITLTSAAGDRLIGGSSALVQRVDALFAPAAVAGARYSAQSQSEVDTEQFAA